MHRCKLLQKQILIARLIYCTHMHPRIVLLRLSYQYQATCVIAISLHSAELGWYSTHRSILHGINVCANSFLLATIQKVGFGSSHSLVASVVFRLTSALALRVLWRRRSGPCWQAMWRPPAPAVAWASSSSWAASQATLPCRPPWPQVLRPPPRPAPLAPTHAPALVSFTSLTSGKSQKFF